MKTIGGKLIIAITVLLSVTCLALGFISYLSSSRALEEQVKTNLVWKAEDVSTYMEEVFHRQFVEVEAIAEQAVIQNMNLEEQFAYLNEQMEKRTDYLAFGIIDAKGISYYSDGTTADLSDRDYVKQAFNGETAMSDILISRVTNEPVIMIATPIATTTGEKALLLARMDGYVWANVVKEIKVGESGQALIVNAAGNIQAHSNEEYVKNEMNFITHAEETGELMNEAAAIKEILNKQAGFLKFVNESNSEQFVGYYTLSNGWKMVVLADQSEMMAGLKELNRKSLISSILFLLLGSIIALFISRSLSKPVKELVHLSEELATGDFTTDINDSYKTRKDELGNLARSLEKMTDSMKNMIQKVGKNANQVNQASANLIHEVHQIASMTASITSAMEDVEGSSVMTSKMTEESARAMEQMTREIQQVSEVATTITDHTKRIETQITNGHEAIHNSIQQMAAIKESTKLELDVIRKLEEESKEIGAITNMISAISDQTNLLALNASIEAARAGEAGKGFAVVADEVRKLSEQTAQSVAQINRLITSVQAYTSQAVNAAEKGGVNVQQGISTIHSVELRFEEIVAELSKITSEIVQLSKSTEEMSSNSEEVSASIEEMSSTAESSVEFVQEVTESTRSQQQAVNMMNNNAKELADMAEELKLAISQFKL